ncbi:MAG: alanine racemase, partial [bacterium]
MSGLPERIQEVGLPALGRDAWVEVRLDAIATNVRALKGKLPAGGHLDVVLKADAYGLGAVPVARAALDAGARAILVATFDEAQELRDAGITSPVRVLWRVAPAHLRDAAATGIGVTVSSPAVVRELMGADLAGLPPLSVDIEVDTGLGRDGILPGDLATQIAALRSN